MDSNERKIVQELVTALGSVIPATDGYEPKTNLWNKYSAAKNMLAAAPQVVADERALSLLSGISRTIISLRDGWGDKNDADEAIANIAEVKSALAAAPVQASNPVEFDGIKTATVQAQEPVACGCKGVGGCVTSVELSAGEFCKASCFSAAEQMAFRAPVQPVDVPDGWKLMPVRMNPEMKSILKEAAPKWNAESIYGNLLEASPAAPAAQGDAKELTDADFKKGELGWRPKCCDGGGAFSNCCDYGGCAANRERAAIAAKAAS